MPIHDWTRVGAGTWHAFHLSWIAELQLVLNDGLLPPGYYAQAEQVARPFGPDILALQGTGPAGPNGPESDPGGGVAVAVTRPQTRITQTGDLAEYARRRRALVVRHASGDGIVALVEVVSPGDKASRYPFETFVRKAADALAQGFHLLIVDLFPPTPRDPEGLHAAVWAEVEPGTPAIPAPPDEPLTLAAYRAEPELTAYVEPTAVGRTMIDMPLFLTPGRYVNVPLEATYVTAFRGVPGKWKQVLG